MPLLVWSGVFFFFLRPPRQIFGVFFAPVSRGGNFGLPSTRIVYSSSYGIYSYFSIRVCSPLLCVYIFNDNTDTGIGNQTRHRPSLVPPGMILTSALPTIVAPHSHPSMPRLVSPPQSLFDGNHLSYFQYFRPTRQQCSQQSSPSVFEEGRDGLWLMVRLCGGARTDYARRGEDRTDHPLGDLKH